MNIHDKYLLKELLYYGIKVSFKYVACGLWGWLHNIVHHLCWVASFSQCYKHRAFSFLWELDWNQKEATRTILILELAGKERLKQ